MAALAATNPQEQARLVRALTTPTLHGDSCADIRVIETHISYVLLTGRYAYKIKKAVDLGFLDFTTLAARHFYCDRELELNRRLAPAIYLEVVAITGAIDAPRIGGDGPAVEYAVKMREFPQGRAAHLRPRPEGVDGCAHRYAGLRRGRVSHVGAEGRTRFAIWISQ
jgi:uncharacterized protein